MRACNHTAEAAVLAVTAVVAAAVAAAAVAVAVTVTVAAAALTAGAELRSTPTAAVTNRTLQLLLLHFLLAMCTVYVCIWEQTTSH
jgi:hypothetical protein